MAIQRTSGCRGRVRGAQEGSARWDVRIPWVETRGLGPVQRVAGAEVSVTVSGHGHSSAKTQDVKGQSGPVTAGPDNESPSASRRRGCRGPAAGHAGPALAAGYFGPAACSAGPRPTGPRRPGSWPGQLAGQVGRCAGAREAPRENRGVSFPRPFRSFSESVKIYSPRNNPGISSPSPFGVELLQVVRFIEQSTGVLDSEGVFSSEHGLTSQSGTDHTRILFP